MEPRQSVTPAGRDRHVPLRGLRDDKSLPDIPLPAPYLSSFPNPKSQILNFLSASPSSEDVSDYNRTGEKLGGMTLMRG